MAKLTREDVLKLAQLTRLELSADEVEEFRGELSQLLAYVEQLQSVDIGGFEPTNQVSGLVNVMRSDKVKDYGYTPEELLKNVPKVRDGQIEAPRMIY